MNSAGKNKRTNGSPKQLAPVASVPPDADAQIENQQATERPGLDYEIAHRLDGRLRLVVQQLKTDPDKTSGCLLKLAETHGILGVRTNYWAASVVIDYDPEIIDEDEVLLHVDEIELPEGAVVASTKASLVMRVARRAIAWLERAMPSVVQLGLGIGAFAASALGLPAPITRTLLTASVAPIATRALQTLVNERKFGVDALDGSAATLMIANGHLVEAAFMTMLISIGEFIRECTARRCEKIVNDLLGLSGRSAWLVKGKKRVCVPADEVRVGDTVVVYPGDMVPVDGSVIRGEAAVDQSKLTGESIPVEVTIGSKVLASTVAVEGKIYIRCEATGADTKAGMVLDSLASAPLHETRIQNYASVVADRMVVPIFIASGVCFGMTRNLVRLMSMLIFDFSTGIRIAAPTAVLSSMYRAGQRGILIKSGAALENLAHVDAIIFDKTGTLTSGEPRVTEVVELGKYSKQEILSNAAAVEQRLHHPASRAIVKHAHQMNIKVPDRAESVHMRGMGVRADVGRLHVAVGSKRLMESEGVDTRAAKAAEAAATARGESFAYVAIDGTLAGLITYADKMRAETLHAIKELRKLGVKKMVMATGDSEAAAHAIARSCGIEEVSARAFPEQKAELVKKLREAGYRVAVIGDGINDSPALAHADVAISLHGGTEAARHSADVVLTDDDLRRLPEAIKIARSAMQLVQQNLTLAVVPNSAGLGLAAFGMVGPAGATLLNNGSAICAALNSLRPLYFTNWTTETGSEQ